MAADEVDLDCLMKGESPTSDLARLPSGGQPVLNPWLC
jgi:hypothetical protein